MQKSLFIVSLLIPFLGNGMASAQINVSGSPDTGSPIKVSAFGSTVNGAGTANAQVHVWYRNHYAGVIHESAQVVAISSTDGEALGGYNPHTGGPLWRLVIRGDTAANPWLFEGLTNTAHMHLYEIERIEIDLLKSFTAFDRRSLLRRNTRGTVGGITFAHGATTTFGHGPMLVDYRYVNPLYLRGRPKGDVFAKLDLHLFDGLMSPGGFNGTSWMDFAVDTAPFTP
jgi:hypothetical protein